MTDPWMVALEGPAGSGKSTLGRALGRSLSWPLIGKDDVRDYLEDHQAGIAYEIMFRIARTQLAQGLNVICDSPLGYQRSYDSARNIALQTGARLVIVECRCGDDDVLRERINARNLLGLASHHTTDWESHRKRQHNSRDLANYAISHPHLVVDTLVPAEQLCDQVVRWLRRQGLESR